MQTEINARHFTLGEEQREAIEAALEKLERFSPRPVESMKVTVDHDAGTFQVDGVLFLKHNEFRASAEGREPEYAVNELVENLRAQLIKFKGKISGRQKAGEGGLGKALLEGEGALPIQDPEPRGFVLKDMDPEAAREAFQAGDLPFLVFRNVETSGVGIIYRREDGQLGHMESTGE